MILGDGRHGKDSVCEYLRDKYGYRFISSSLFMAENVVRPWLAEKCGIEYVSVEACYADRHNHRADWFNAIAAFNGSDPSALTRAIFAADNDIYAGCRNAREVHHGRLARAFDLVIWVDASMRVGPEPETSCTVKPWMADVILDNNAAVTDLHRNIDILHAAWLQPMSQRIRHYG